MSTLNTKAMIIDLSISAWTARKYDKAISREVTTAHNADEKAARVTKQLFPFQAPVYQAIHTIAGEARRTHDFETLPWNDKGERILLAVNYQKYSDKMRQLKNKFDGAVPEFLDEWEDLKASSRAALNGMYREEDFPTLDKLKKKFSFSTSVEPIPSASDFRVTLQAEAVDDIREQIERENQSRFAAAMRAPYERLYEVVSKMAEKLNDPDATFHKTLVTHTREVCDHVVKALNLGDDQELKDISAKIQAGLCEFEPDMLRDNQRVRECVGARAKEVMEDLRAFMSAA